jgi:methylated-DNA-[protein]-cysteine S-methyltransferase
MMRYTVIDSPIGDAMLVGGYDDTEQFALRGVYLTGQKYEPFVGADWVRDPSPLTDAVEQLDAFFAGALSVFELRTDAQGSPFQRSVWSALSEIPYGTTCTYGAVALRVADRTRTRAAAAAIGRNPLGVVVPCHRVIGADGSLTGYAGGLDRKRWLLDHEAAVSGSMLRV